jgi:predicted  nucleic acid-binding Zn-ribbon protein
MNRKNILVAIEERNRWIGRRNRLAHELEVLLNEKAAIQSEIAAVKKEIAKLDEAYTILSTRGSVSTDSAVFIDTIR